MKRRKSNAEPTLHDVLSAMQDGFAKVDERFGLVEARIDQRFGVLKDRADNTDARIGDMQRTLAKVQNRVEDIQDDLTTALTAQDADSSKILDHERRIRRLEKAA